MQNLCDHNSTFAKKLNFTFACAKSKVKFHCNRQVAISRKTCFAYHYKNGGNMVRNIAIAIIGFIVFLQLVCFFLYRRDGYIFSEYKQVSLPKYALFLGLICQTIFCAFSIIAIIKDPIVSYFFIPFLLLGALLVVGFLNQRVYYNEREFISKTIFCRKRVFEYRDITGISYNIESCYLHTNTKKVFLDYVTNYQTFLNLCRKKYENIHGSQLPKINKKRKIK